MLLGHSEFFGGGRFARDWHAHAKSVRRPREQLYAAIQLLFAIQQLSEGVIWLSFRYEVPQLNTVMTHVYNFFSHVLWPVYVPWQYY